MGEAYAKEVMKITKPRVALLSNGEEESKGNELTKEAHALLKKMPNVIGNGEEGIAAPQRLVDAVEALGHFQHRVADESVANQRIKFT